MTSKNIGIGSGSLVLILTVLCLVFFSMISYTSANNDLRLARAGADAVVQYYEADTSAVRFMDELSAREDKAPVVEFTCYISEEKELYVKLVLEDGGYNIAAWQVRATGLWLPDMNLPVWQGD